MAKKHLSGLYTPDPPLNTQDIQLKCLVSIAHTLLAISETLETAVVTLKKIGNDDCRKNRQD